MHIPPWLWFRLNWRPVWIIFDVTLTGAVAAGCCWVIWGTGIDYELPWLVQPVVLTAFAVGGLTYVALGDVRNARTGRNPTVFDGALILRITLGWVILGFFLIDQGSEIGYAVIFAWPTWLPVLAAYWAYRRERLTALAYAMSIPPLFLLLISDAPAEIRWQAYLVPGCGIRCGVHRGDSFSVGLLTNGPTLSALHGGGVIMEDRAMRYISCPGRMPVGGRGTDGLGGILRSSDTARRHFRCGGQ